MENVYEIPDELFDQLGQAARQVEVAFWRGNFDQARTIVNSAERLRRDGGHNGRVELDGRLGEIELPVRIVATLWDHGIRNVGQLLASTRATVESISGISDRTWALCREKLAKYGYRHGENTQRIRDYAKTGYRIPFYDTDDATDRSYARQSVDASTQPPTPTTNGKPMDNLEAALNVLTDPNAAASLDRKIAELEAKLLKLKSIRKAMFAKPTNKSGREFKKNPRHEALIIDHVKKNGPQKPGVIAKALQLSNVAVGLIVANTDRLAKNDAGEVIVA